jgi:hypothetical protein
MLNNSTPSATLVRQNSDVSLAHIVLDTESVKAEWNSLSFIILPIASQMLWNFGHALRRQEMPMQATIWMYFVAGIGIGPTDIAIPYATIERAFSLMNIVHCKLRNNGLHHWLK